MFYIKNQKNELGAFPPPQKTTAEGLVMLPEEMLDVYIEYSGFVNLGIADGVVFSVEPDITAYAKWKSEQEEITTAREEQTSDNVTWEELDKAYNEGRDSAYDS